MHSIHGSCRRVCVRKSIRGKTPEIWWNSLILYENDGSSRKWLQKEYIWSDVGHLILAIYKQQLSHYRYQEKIKGRKSRNVELMRFFIHVLIEKTITTTSSMVRDSNCPCSIPMCMYLVPSPMHECCSSRYTCMDVIHIWM